MDPQPVYVRLSEGLEASLEGMGLDQEWQQASSP